MTDAAVIRRNVGAFSRMTVVWLVLVGVISFVGLLILSAYAPQLRGRSGDETHALSRSAVGFAGLAELLRAQHRDVQIARGALRHGEKAGLVIATPRLGAESSDVSDIDIKGPKLVVLPKWLAAPDPRHQGWVVRIGVAPTRAIIEVPKAYVPATEIKRRKDTAAPRLFWANGDPLPGPAPISNLQTLSGRDWKPVVVDERGAIVVGRVSETYFLADPDLLNTHGLADLRTATTAMALVDQLSDPSGPVVLDVTAPGGAHAKNVLKLAFEPPFLGATLCVAIAALLMGLHAAVRFGPVKASGRAFALGKEALVENSAALVRMARREHRMAERYALAHRAQVARAIGVPHGLDDDTLNGLLDRAGRAAGAGLFTELLAEARRAANPADLMTVARKLYDWRVEMTRERR